MKYSGMKYSGVKYSGVQKSVAIELAGLSMHLSIMC